MKPLNKLVFYVSMFVLLININCAQYLILSTVSDEPKLVQQSNNIKLSTAYWDSIFILSPKLNYRDVYTEKELSPSEHEADKTSKEIVEYIKSNLTKKGYTITSEADLTPEQVEMSGFALDSLIDQSKVLLKKEKDDRLLEYLNQLHNATKAEVVVMQVGNIKVGAKKSLQGSSVLSSTSTTNLIVFIINTKTGDVLWKNEVFFRESPNSKIIKKSIEMLFSEFPDQGKETIK